jgi:hypothetical protein
MYEGAGLRPEDVDIFNPCDGYAPMAQFFLEACGFRRSRPGIPIDVGHLFRSKSAGRSD